MMMIISNPVEQNERRLCKKCKAGLKVSEGFEVERLDFKRIPSTGQPWTCSKVLTLRKRKKRRQGGDENKK